MSDPEPRRSVRATKGQHTKAFEELGNGVDLKNKRQGKKGGKKSPQKEETQDEDEEVIRCICGATTQEDDDANEPWIACDKCGAWQHNVCVGMSVFTEDLTKDYFCEQCAPDDHKETLEAMAKGEKPWEARRQKYEDDKKKKKGKKGKGKRVSDGRDKEKEGRSSPETAPPTAKPKVSPAPDIKKEEVSQDLPAAAAKGKRKSHDHSQGPQPKIQKVADEPAVATPSYPPYTPPDDLVAAISDLESTRQQKAKAILKSLDVAIEQAERKGQYALPTDTTKKAVTERLAIEIERAFHDAHGNNAGAAAQLRTLVFNLKGNIDLAAQLFNRTLPPPSFVVMTGEELANKELQKENAELKAKAEKQSILIQAEGPRMRRTHKGEEVVEGDDYTTSTDEAPSALRRADEMDVDTEEPAKQQNKPTTTPLRVDTKVTQGSPKQQNFDIGKVFNSVARSPSISHQRRQSTHVQSAGPGEDADVDRLLQDGTESPPYSPTEELDTDVIWRGPLVMTSIADVSISAKHVGGADLKKAKDIEWNDLVPAVLTVAGRIPEEKAVPYLCAMRWNNQIDLVITSLAPSNPSDENAKKQFNGVINYFQSKKRYGVVGEKKLGNVRDTYLIPIAEGDGPLPEPVQNIGDHKIPLKRTEPMLLLVFVVRDEKQIHIPPDQQKMELQGASPTPSSEQSTPAPHRASIASAPTYSPATPQAPQGPGSIHPPPPPPYSQTPIPPPTIPGQPPQHQQQHQPQQQQQRQQPHPSTAPSSHDPNAAAMRAAQAEGEKKARQVLGPLFASATVTFLLPHAARMKEGEWNAVKRCLERDPRARDDLPLLSKLLTEEGNNARQAGQQQQQQQQSAQVQRTMAAGARQPSPAGPPRAGAHPSQQQGQQQAAAQGKQQSRSPPLQGQLHQQSAQQVSAAVRGQPQQQQLQQAQGQAPAQQPAAQQQAPQQAQGQQGQPPQSKA